MLDNFEDLDVPEDDEILEDGGNRSFLMVAGGIGGLIVVAMIMMAAYVFFLRPDPVVNNEPVATVDESEANFQSTADALNEALTGTAIVMAYTPTVTNTPVPPTATEVVVVEEPTQEVVVDPPTQDPRTATVQALLTQASIAQTQAVLSTSTPTPLPDGTLPDTGFLDDFGAPTLAGIALLMVLIIFTARRLRQVNS